MGTLKVMGDNWETNHLKNFNKAYDTIQKIENYQKHIIVSSGICKNQKHRS